MLGFVLTEWMELMEEDHGTEFVDEVMASCNLTDGGAYTAIDVYPAEDLHQILGEVSRRLDQSVPQLLMSYGERLFRSLAEGHPKMMEGYSHPFDLFEHLESHVHAEVKCLHEGAQVPTLTFQREAENVAALRYRSSRGLPDLAEGLMRGACRHYEQSIETVERIPHSEDATDVTLVLTLASVGG
ncbi:MAG: heme NO-binding domain-containing protein [Acidobacteriota bacterium]